MTHSCDTVTEVTVLAHGRFCAGSTSPAIAGHDLPTVGRGAPTVRCGLPRPTAAGRSPPVVMLPHQPTTKGEA